MNKHKNLYNLLNETTSVITNSHRGGTRRKSPLYSRAGSPDVPYISLHYDVPWLLLSNGHLRHRSGVELYHDGLRWAMTEASALHFVLYSMRACNLSTNDAKAMADKLLLEGVQWFQGLHSDQLNKNRVPMSNMH